MPVACCALRGDPRGAQSPGHEAGGGTRVASYRRTKPKEAIHSFKLLKNRLYFPFLVLNGIWHYWICSLSSSFFGGGLKQMEDINNK